MNQWETLSLAETDSE